MTTGPISFGSNGSPLLNVVDLTVVFGSGGRNSGRRVVANNCISLSVAAGETLGVVGESGSGKSVFCRALLRLLPAPPARISARHVTFQGQELLELSEREMRRIRGQGIAMIFQNPMSSLNPVWTIGDQIGEVLRLYKRIDRRAAQRGAIALLDKVGIASAARRIDEYPFQWSGGMLQRAMIAMALAGEPKMILADEPTTALDVTIQDQILSLLMDLQRETGMALVLVSHDMGIIAETCDRVAVMYAGRIVELGSTFEIFKHPAHPYTAGLLNSVIPVDRTVKRLASIPGQPPDLTLLGAGCAFAERCSLVLENCRKEPIPFHQISSGHLAACPMSFSQERSSLPLDKE
jgi:oligopeptide/dipeptide ABC transporter ATP-binding protein